MALTAHYLALDRLQVFTQLFHPKLVIRSLLSIQPCTITTPEIQLSHFGQSSELTPHCQQSISSPAITYKHRFSGAID